MSTENEISPFCLKWGKPDPSQCWISDCPHTITETASALHPHQVGGYVEPVHRTFALVCSDHNFRHYREEFTTASGLVVTRRGCHHEWPPPMRPPIPPNWTLARRARARRIMAAYAMIGVLLSGCAIWLNPRLGLPILAAVLLAWAWSRRELDKEIARHTRKGGQP